MLRKSLLLIVASMVIFSCSKVEERGESKLPSIAKRVEAYAPFEISVDMSHLSDRQNKLVLKLVEAGRYADLIFWNQSSHDALAEVNILRKDPKADKNILEYVKINYGPYDRIYEQQRFWGHGPKKKPAGAGFYPEDLTKEVFNQYVMDNPEKADLLKSQFSVVVHDDSGFNAIPYHDFYGDEVDALAQKLNEAAELADNPSLKAYLLERAKAVLTDDYYKSDEKWMKIRDNDIDVVIGPIENYEDEMFNYKTAYEAAVMIKDPQGTEKLQKYIAHLDNLEKQLPEKKEYIRPSAGKGNILEVVNIVYFGGDFQAGIKTIAASLPNDPAIHQKYGGKKQMYKNMMEAKFQKILIPISEKLLAKEDLQYIDKDAFTDFVTLHEVSHTLGRGYVFDKDKVKVRTALKETYSAIEEAKADILAIFATPYLVKNGVYTEESVKKRYVTYLAGLFRSIRFGVEEAHGKSNICQFNFLREKGAILMEGDKWKVDFDKFHSAVTQFSAKVLNLEAEGDYDGALEFLEKYGRFPDDLARDFKSLEDIPRDLNTTYAILKELK